MPIKPKSLNTSSPNKTKVHRNNKMKQLAALKFGNPAAYAAVKAAMNGELVGGGGGGYGRDGGTRMGARGVTKGTAGGEMLVAAAAVLCVVVG